MEEGPPHAPGENTGQKREQEEAPNSPDLASLGRGGARGGSSKKASQVRPSIGCVLLQCPSPIVGQAGSPAARGLEVTASPGPGHERVRRGALRPRTGHAPRVREVVTTRTAKAENPCLDDPGRPPGHRGRRPEDAKRENEPGNSGPRRLRSGERRRHRGSNNGPQGKSESLGESKSNGGPEEAGNGPGQWGRGAMRRPSHREETEDPWEAGLVMPLHTVPAGKLVPGCSLVLTEADYFGAMIKAAGVIRKVEADHHSSHAYLRLTGTDHEGVLKMHTSRQDPLFRVHICPTGCERMEHGDLLIHALRGRQRGKVKTTSPGPPIW